MDCLRAGTRATIQLRGTPLLGNLSTLDHENIWETVETIELWIADRKSVEGAIPSALTKPRFLYGIRHYADGPR